MFDIWWGDIELTVLVLIVSVAVLLPVQLFLCFNVKNRTARLLPVVMLSVLAAVFAIICLAMPGWDGLGYAFLAVFAVFMALMCGAGWGIWGIVSRLKRKRRSPLRANGSTYPAAKHQNRPLVYIPMCISGLFLYLFLRTTP